MMSMTDHACTYHTGNVHDWLATGWSWQHDVLTSPDEAVELER